MLVRIGAGRPRASTCGLVVTDGVPPGVDVSREDWESPLDFSLPGLHDKMPTSGLASARGSHSMAFSPLFSAIFIEETVLREASL